MTTRTYCEQILFINGPENGGSSIIGNVWSYFQRGDKHWKTVDREKGLIIEVSTDELITDILQKAADLNMLSRSQQTQFADGRMAYDQIKLETSLFEEAAQLSLLKTGLLESLK